MKIYTLKALLAFCLILSLLNGYKAFAQPATKDNNINRDPMIMVPGYKAPNGKAAQASVITIGDYDNYKLGVDFAECSITCNPTNPTEFYAVWNITGTAGGKGYRTSNGFDWTASNPTWTGMAGDVVVTSDSTGRLIYENMYGNISGCKVATSADFGQTWDPFVVAISGADKNWIAADQTGGAYSNYIYTVMTANSGGNHARSINNGASFTNTQNMNTQAIPGMMVAVGPKDALQGGSVYVVTNSGSSFASTFTFYESNDGGASYTFKSAQNFSNYVGVNSNGRNSVQNMRTRPYPFIAVDNSNGAHRGRLYLVYASNYPAGNGNKPDIFCRYSDDGGTTWSAAKTVNDDANTVNNYNWFPAIWHDSKTERLYISWMDTRDCPTGDSAMIYATYTTDGVTFKTNKQISNKKMKINCTTCGGGGSPAYLGDYNGVAANGVTSLMAWTDFRDGSFGSYVGYFPDFGFRAEPALDTITPEAIFYAKVPSVKHYTDTVFVTASVSGGLGMFNVTYPEGNQLWSYPGQIPIKITNNTAPVGDYTVTIIAKGSNGTPIHQRTATVRVVASVPPVAQFTSTNTNPCEGQAVNFSDLSAGPPSSWLWSFPGATPATSTAQNPTGIVYSTEGTYDVTLTVTNLMGSNTVVMSNYITVKPSPEPPTSSNAAICFGQPVPELTASGTDLIWYSGSNVVGNGPTFNTGQASAGVYNYTVTQTTNSCESQPTAVSLTINELPAVYLSPLDTVCESDAIFNLYGGTPIGGIYSGTGVDSGVTFNPATAGAGNHDITYYYSDANGCTNSYIQSITVNAKPQVTINTVDPVCVSALPVKLSAFPEGGIFAGKGVSGDTLYPAVAGVGEISISYTYSDPANGCPGNATQIVKINSLPVVAINDTSVCGNQTLTFDVAINNPQSYVWTPGGATTSAIDIDTIGKGLGTHVYSVTVTDANGCIATDQASISFFDCTGIEEQMDSKILELYPNPSTGQFAIRSSSIPAGKYELSVFEVHGKIVYSETVNIEDEFLHPLDLSKLSNGIYVLHLKNKQNGYYKRFIINK